MPVPKKHQESRSRIRNCFGSRTRMVAPNSSAAMPQRSTIAPVASTPQAASVRVNSPISPQRQPAAMTDAVYLRIAHPSIRKKSYA